jgi:bifunctional enzyme CysN/CysC
MQDQLEAVEKTSRNSGEEEVNLALLMDGLKAEREQKITIDVAYRYFATPRRKFIIADTPGHIQYTRNMVTGASTADLAIVLIDARKGVLTQSRRHAFIASLLQIPHMVVAVNKMDLVEYGERVFREIVEEFTRFAEKLNIDDITFIPISALKGDNIVNKSERMDWYDGSTLMYTLENVQVGSRRNRLDFRFPVQYVIRPHQDFRGFAGTVASGSVRVGDEVMALPSKMRSRVKSVQVFNDEREAAATGEAVILTIEDEIDISRGDMLVRTKNIPEVDREFEAVLCWMHEEAFRENREYIIQHTTRRVRAVPQKLYYKIDVDTLHREPAEELGLNEIGRVRFAVAQPLFFDPYAMNNATGSFIVIDPVTMVTVGAGMIRGVQADEDVIEAPVKREASPNVVWEEWNIPRKERMERHGHAPKVIWLTGVSGAGKSTIASASGAASLGGRQADGVVGRRPGASRVVPGFGF